MRSGKELQVLLVSRKINIFFCLLLKKWGLCSQIGLMVFFLLIASGCGTELPLLKRLRPLPSDNQICRVAVLPFVNESEYPYATTLAYKIFYTELNKQSDYIVAQEGDVRRLYQQLRILPGQSVTRDQLLFLASRLNVQLIFTGNIIEMRENRLSQEGRTNPVLAIQIEILDGRTVDTLWSIYHRREGLEYQKVMHFGIINSISGLCQQVTIEIINLFFSKGLSPCDVSRQS